MKDLPLQIHVTIALRDLCLSWQKASASADVQVVDDADQLAAAINSRSAAPADYISKAQANNLWLWLNDAVDLDFN